MWLHWQLLFSHISANALSREVCDTAPLKWSFVNASLSPQTENNLWELWNKTGHQGNHWNRAEIPLRKLRNFEVIFEGIRWKDVSGGAALDDIEYIDCAPSEWIHASGEWFHIKHIINVRIWLGINRNPYIENQSLVKVKCLLQFHTMPKFSSMSF